MNWTKFKKYSWFTLLELIIVISIIWILAGSSFITFSNHLIRSRDTKRKFDVNSISMSLGMYYMQSRDYPLPSRAIDILDQSGTQIWYQWVFDVAVVNKWISLNDIPLDPGTKDDYLYTKAIDPVTWKTRYEIGALMELYLDGFDYISWKSFFKRYPYIFEWDNIMKCSRENKLLFPSEVSIINNKYYYFLNKDNSSEDAQVQLDLLSLTWDCDGVISAPIINLSGTNLKININDIELTSTQ